MTHLGNGLCEAGHHEDALLVRQAEMAALQRLGAPVESIVVTMSNLASTYQSLGRLEEALRVWKDVYSGGLRILGEEDGQTLISVLNYAKVLVDLERYKEAKALLRKSLPVARRNLGDCHDTTLRMRWICAEAFYNDDDATLDDRREAVRTLEDLVRIARRVFGGAHPITVLIEKSMRHARVSVALREGDVESIREAVEAMAPGDA